MNIVVADPQNIEAIAKAFPHRSTGVIYAYGDIVYNPSGIVIPPALIAHETAHGLRQLIPEAWWNLYITDPEFRYREELYGHAAELRALKTGDRNRNANLVMQTTLRLLAPFYEYGLSQRYYATARKDLLELAEVA